MKIRNTTLKALINHNNLYIGIFYLLGQQFDVRTVMDSYTDKCLSSPDCSFEKVAICGTISRRLQKSKNNYICT